MQVVYIEGPADIGKSTLINQQYHRLMATGDYTVIDKENEFALSDFRFLLQNKVTRECIVLNSPTDTQTCIKEMGFFISKQLIAGYNITKVVTSIRPQKVNQNLYEQTKNVIKGLFPTPKEVSVNLVAMLNPIADKHITSLI